jgi:transposase
MARRVSGLDIAGTSVLMRGPDPRALREPPADDHAWFTVRPTTLPRWQQACPVRVEQSTGTDGTRRTAALSGLILWCRVHPSRVPRARRGIKATIPEPADQVRNRLRRGSADGRPPAFDTAAYKQRDTVERAFCHLRQHRAIATRYDKRDFVWRGTVDVALIRIWLRIPTMIYRTRSSPPARMVASARRRRQVGLGVLRSFATAVVLVALYYLLPLDRLTGVPLAVILVVGLLVLQAARRQAQQGSTLCATERPESAAQRVRLGSSSGQRRIVYWCLLAGAVPAE